MKEGLRRRRGHVKTTDPGCDGDKVQFTDSDELSKTDTALNDLSNTYWLTRIVFLRALAFIYAVAFLIAFNQNKELIGDTGLLPLKLHLEAIQRYHGQNVTTWRLFTSTPTLFWFADSWNNVNPWLDVISLVGLSLSLLILVTGGANSLVLASLWILYHSLVNVGQAWYSFGWESQLLETGFLAIFIVPWVSWQSVPKELPPPWIGVIGYRWLIMRIMVNGCVLTSFKRGVKQVL